jgi:hypothetical protein
LLVGVLWLGVGRYWLFAYRVPRSSLNRHELRADERRLDGRLPFFQEQLDNLPEVGVEFVEAFRLRMRARKSGNVVNVGRPCAHAAK